MDKTISPLSEGRSDVPERFIISDLLNIPPSEKHHFRKERLIELLPSMACNLNHILLVGP